MPFPHAKKTPEEHARDKAKAEKMIANGLVQSWTDLGAAFNISGSAAAARFGPKGYGLRVPSQAVHENKAKSRGNVTIDVDAMTLALIDQLRGGVPRAKWITNFLVAQLPKVVSGSGEAPAAPPVDLAPVAEQLTSVSAAVELIGDDVTWIVESLRKALGEES